MKYIKDIIAGSFTDLFIKNLVKDKIKKYQLQKERIFTLYDKKDTEQLIRHFFVNNTKFVFTFKSITRQKLDGKNLFSPKHTFEKLVINYPYFERKFKYIMLHDESYIKNSQLSNNLKKQIFKKNLFPLRLNETFDCQVLRTIWAVELSLSNQLEKETDLTLIRPYHETILYIDYIYRRLINKVLHETGIWDQDNVIAKF